MSVYQWPTDPMRGTRYRSDVCDHKHQSREAAERCERQEWVRRNRALRHEVTIRRVFEVYCETCGAVIDAPASRAAADTARREHIEAHQIT